VQWPFQHMLSVQNALRFQCKTPVSVEMFMAKLMNMMNDMMEIFMNGMMMLRRHVHSKRTGFANQYHLRLVLWWAGMTELG
jgi:hypothetical protein